MLRDAPPRLGINVELKYPSQEEVGAFGLRMLPPAEWVGAVWRVVAEEAGGRAIVFSSFDPDVAAAMRALQAVYPVLFLTMAGLELFGDKRMNGLPQAAEWAVEAGLEGVCTHASAVVGRPGVVAGLRERGLLVGTFGGQNNAVGCVEEQVREGVNMIIFDAVGRLGPLPGC